MFHCRMCFFYRKGYKSLDDFRTHLSSKKHAQEVNRIAANTQRREQLQKLSRLYDFEDKHWHWHWREVAKSKAFRTGFCLLDNHLRLKRMRKAFRSRLRDKLSRLEYRAWNST